MTVMIGSGMMKADGMKDSFKPSTPKTSSWKTIMPAIILREE